MSKFKVGDRVRVKGYDEVQYHIGISREGWAEQFLKPCEVVAFEQGDYWVKAHTGTHWWVRPDSLIPLDI